MEIIFSAESCSKDVFYNELNIQSSHITMKAPTRQKIESPPPKKKSKMHIVPNDFFLKYKSELKTQRFRANGEALSKKHRLDHLGPHIW